VVFQFHRPKSDIMKNQSACTVVVANAGAKAMISVKSYSNRVKLRDVPRATVTELDSLIAEIEARGLSTKLFDSVPETQTVSYQQLSRAKTSLSVFL